MSGANRIVYAPLFPRGIGGTLYEAHPRADGSSRFPSPPQEAPCAFGAWRTVIGSYDFYFRTRAATQGPFTQPGAYAELMYDGAVRGNSAGAKLEVGG
jgi:hypothetical protein